LVSDDRGMVGEEFKKPSEDTFGAKIDIEKLVQSSASESKLDDDQESQLLKGVERLYGVMEHLG
jgi:hypothetical protein